MRLEDFRTELRSSGFDEALQKDYAPNELIETHTHPFAARGLVTAGEMAITCDGHTRSYLIGDIFELEPGQVHSERYGPHGATYYVGRKYSTGPSS
jgi:hypothetical protein